MQDAEPKQREQLRAAQRLWIQYRDANCLYYALGEGSIARVESADCTYRMTKSRAEELEGKEDRNQERTREGVSSFRSVDHNAAGINARPTEQAERQRRRYCDAVMRPWPV